MKTQLRQLLTVSLVTAGFASPAIAQSPTMSMDVAARINAANAMLREGKLQEAITDYQQIQPSESNRDELTYNLAVAQFRTGDMEAAKKLFTEASAASDTGLAASSRYNLGNCYYSDAVQAAEQDKGAAIASLHEAISHYRAH